MSVLSVAVFEDLGNVASGLISLETSLAQLRAHVADLLSQRNEAIADQLADVPNRSESGQTAGILSSSKRRRIRCARTKRKLWQTQRGDTDVGNDIDVEEVQLSSFWEQMEICSHVPCEREWCMFDSIVTCWNAADIETWLRETLRHAKQVAMAASSLEEADRQRKEVIDERWAITSTRILAKLRNEILEMLSESVVPTWFS